jgi:hypothetical protein
LADRRHKPAAALFKEVTFFGDRGLIARKARDKQRYRQPRDLPHLHLVGDDAFLVARSPSSRSS